MRSNASAARRRSRKQRWNNDFDKRGAASRGANADAFVRVSTEVASWVKSQAPSSKSQPLPNPNPQCKSQLPTPTPRRRAWLGILGFGIWELGVGLGRWGLGVVGIWSLELGI